MKIKIEIISLITTLAALLAIIVLTFTLSTLLLPRLAGATDCRSDGCYQNVQPAFEKVYLNLEIPDESRKFTHQNPAL